MAKQDQVVEMWNSGIDKKEIAEKLGITIGTVNTYLCHARKAGQEVRKQERKTGKQEQVVEMWNFGIDKKEIAEKLGITIGTVSVYLSKARKSEQEVRKIEKQDQVIEMWNSGIDKKEIAEKLGITINAVNKHLYKARKTGQEVRKQDQVIEMWNSGIDKKEIAEKLGITINGVNCHLYKATKAGQGLRKNPVKRGRKIEKQDQVVEMWNSGINKKEIAEKLEITINTVSTYLYQARKAGQELRKNPVKRGRKIEKQDQVVEMWNSGIDKKEIAEKLGITINAVYYHLYRARKTGQEVRKQEIKTGKQEQTVKKVSKEKKTKQENSSLNTPKIEKAKGQGIDIKSKIMAMLCTNLPIDVAEKLKIKPFVVYDIVDSLSEEEKKEILKKFVRSKKEVFSYVRNKKEKGISILAALKALKIEKGNKLYRELSEIYLIMGLQNQAEGVLNSIIANDSGANVYIRDQVTMQLHKIKTEILAQNIRTDYYKKRNIDNTRISYGDLCKRYNVRFSFLLQILGMERAYTDKQNSDR